MHIFCDFDGTISARDTTDLVLDHLADPAWEAIEARWLTGEIDAAACMAGQIGLIDAPVAAIDALLDGVALREGFVGFVEWTRREGIPLTIVSDGVDHFIAHVLARHGVGDLPIIANRLVSRGDGGWALAQPWRMADCAGGSGVCKCAIVGATQSTPVVFIGDGRSDFCVATRPDLLFATAGLEQFCRERTIPHRPFESFADIQAILETLDADLLARAA